MTYWHCCPLSHCVPAKLPLFGPRYPLQASLWTHWIALSEYLYDCHKVYRVLTWNLLKTVRKLFHFAQNKYLNLKNEDGPLPVVSRDMVADRALYRRYSAVVHVRHEVVRMQSTLHIFYERGPCAFFFSVGLKLLRSLPIMLCTF